MPFIIFINNSWNINSCRKCAYIRNIICEIDLFLRDETNVRVNCNIYKNTKSKIFASFPNIYASFMKKQALSDGK